MPPEDVCYCPASAEPAPTASGSLPADQPLLVVIGAQKAGTTWLLHALHAMPELLLARDCYKYVAFALAVHSPQIRALSRSPLL